MILFNPGDRATFLIDTDPSEELISMEWLFQAEKGWEVFTWDEDTGKWDLFHFYGDEKDFKKYYSESKPATEEQLRKLVNVLFSGEREDEDD